MERSQNYNTKVSFEIPLHIETIGGVFFTWTYQDQEQLHEYLVKEMKKHYNYPEWYYSDVEFTEIKQMKQEEIDLWIKEFLLDE